MELPSAQLLLGRALILTDFDKAQGQLAAAATHVLAWRTAVEMCGFVSDLERFW